MKGVRELRAAGLAVIVVALAAHTYRDGSGAPGHETTFLKDVRRLGRTGTQVRVVRRPGGVAAFAGGRRRRVEAARGEV